ncbi:protein FAM8A1 [Denticeps clupeoides]|uniref:RDD domain-containing protein n=1 Tax=Denticeps clupeoides TaxID=299321 RepID=A0AAY4DPK6_9TELE|nr:protein FAM8A1-like [Denticeps clupeoides]
MADSEENPNGKGKASVNDKMLSGEEETGNMEEGKKTAGGSSRGQGRAADTSTSEYCQKLQEWMWQYHVGYLNWQNWVSLLAFSCPPCLPLPQTTSGSPGASSVLAPPYFYPSATGQISQTEQAGVNTSGAVTAAGSVQQQQQQQNGNAQQPGREYAIPSPIQRFMAEMVDFFILFFIKATIILSIMHLSGMKDISKFAMHFIVEEIDEDTSMEELQKMMLVALVYRILVCFYEIVCIWGAGGATPGKFLLGLRVITCDTSVLVRPNRVLVVPASNVSLSASTVRALNKNFSIAFFFPAFITLLFFQHNRTVYDIVAGTIVVKRRRLR